MRTRTLVKAAQYVRMSTDKQIYSTANQIDAIRSYAAAHGFEIVHTYADEGRSGLRIKGRAALQEMLRDVLTGELGYRAILVFDVSRWGRFQDTDESAHYEWLCRNSGVPVHYCAEGFENDGSLASTIVKNLRRAMAGEFSRDLSAKVWSAQRRLVSMGYKMGGAAGYGLNRLLIDETGRPKQILAKGEHKSIASDRVLLVPGDPDEIATVKRIFRLATRGKSNRAIAEILNGDEVPAPVVAKWDQNTIRQMLKAERYLGVITYNKRSAKLGSGYTQNPEADWVRGKVAFKPIISLATFNKVQRLKRAAASGFSEERLLEHLRRLLECHGRISSDIIDKAGQPTAKTYSNRFGSLANAYARIGYQVGGRAKSTSLSAELDDYSKEVCRLLASQGGTVSSTVGHGLITLDEQVNILPVIAHLRDDARGSYWRVKLMEQDRIDVVAAALMKDGARQDIYIFPARRIGKSRKVDIRDGPNLMEAYRLWSLEYLREMIVRSADFARR